MDHHMVGFVIFVLVTFVVLAVAMYFVVQIADLIERRKK